jgi:plasmid stabilization system protein ParE
MRYTVCWRPTAERKLNEIWNEATDKSAVSEAADAIESELQSRAGMAGESRGDEARFLSVAPLAVYFDVHEDDRTVDVWSVFRV